MILKCLMSDATKHKIPLCYLILNSNFQAGTDYIFLSKYLIILSGLLDVSRLLNKNETKLHYKF